MTGSPVLRPYRPFDLPGLYDVCLRTGDSGADGTHLYANRDLLGHVYAGPYPVADPSLTFVLADEHGVLGYVLGTADTDTFEQWCEEHWWPGLREQYPVELAVDTGDVTRDWQLVGNLHQRRPRHEPLYERYPAHLHIDILARGQRRGFGRSMIQAFTEALRERGVPGVHLGVGAENTGAQAFYRRIGFTEERAEPWGSTMMLDLQHGLH